MPESFWQFLRHDCHLRREALQPMSGTTLPEPSQRLLVHDRDMTSTLATFHGSALRVAVLQCRELGGIYLREVFLRRLNDDRVVEYGVIAISLGEFTPPQQEAIRRGQMPLGGLLHQFEIRFESSPIQFFSVGATELAATPLATLTTAACFGRLNRLAKPTGEPLAWILEILPPS